MEIDETRTCKKCGESLHVMEFRHQKPDYLGMWDICIECEADAIELIKETIEEYCAPSDQYLTDETQDKFDKIDAIKLVLAARGTVRQRAVVEHCTMLLEVCIQLLNKINLQAKGAKSQGVVLEQILRVRKARFAMVRYKNKLKKGN